MIFSLAPAPRHPFIFPAVSLKRTDEIPRLGTSNAKAAGPRSRDPVASREATPRHGMRANRHAATERLSLFPDSPSKFIHAAAWAAHPGLAELMNHGIRRNLPPCSSLARDSGSSAQQESVLTPDLETHTLTLRWREGFLGSSPWHKLKSENGPAIPSGSEVFPSMCRTEWGFVSSHLLVPFYDSLLSQ